MPTEITDEQVRSAAARLHEGGWSFSARQLYYAVCAQAERAPVRLAPGEVGLGVLLILVGAITGQRILLEVLGGIGAVLVVVGAITRVQERHPVPASRSLVLSYADFERRFLADAAGCAGLIASDAASERTGTDGALVVCDRTETAAVLVANVGRVGEVRIRVNAEEDRVRGRRVVVVHDCDPAGCALVGDLRDAGADVVDAGINPAEVAGRRLQVIEGAPARLPRDLSGHLDPAQVGWLLSGRRLECATESPEQLVQRVLAALILARDPARAPV